MLEIIVVLAAVHLFWVQRRTGQNPWVAGLKLFAVLACPPLWLWHLYRLLGRGDIKKFTQVSRGHGGKGGHPGRRRNSMLPKEKTRNKRYKQ